MNLFAALALVATLLTGPPKTIVLIVVDDLGYHDLGHTGSPLYLTPNIDRLAASGMRFTQALSNAPVCSPARASLMTGRFPSRHGVTDWIGALTGERWRSHNRHTRMLPATNLDALPTSLLTLPEAMREAGYTTVLAGKWHLGGDRSTPEDHGFDVNIGGWEHGSPRGGYFDPYDNPKLPNRRPGEHLSMRLADEALAQTRQDKPVFVVLSFYAVHSPLQATPESWRRFRDRADALGIAETGFRMGQYLPERVVQDNPMYAALVEAMDAAVGHLLNGLDDHAVVILTSDNGGVSSGDAFATTNLPLRKGKGSTFEGGLRVPLLLRAPGITTAGSESDTPVTLADLFPTILDLAGQSLRPDQHADGVSLLPLAQGRAIADRALFWHYPHYSNQDGRPSGVIREGDWKLILDYETDVVELYDLRSDPGELRDVASEHQERVHRMETRLREHLRQTGAHFPVADPQHSPEAERKHLEREATHRLNQLERQRRSLLSTDHKP